ncbi:type II toxin-antitoxin system RelE/ParE family toxin [soil metagenome]
MVYYEVRLNKKVRKKDLPKLSHKDVARIVDRISNLAENPYPSDAVQLRGREEWRIRQGNYRILYTVDESIVTVIVLKVGHRRDVYRR